MRRRAIGVCIVVLALLLGAVSLRLRARRNDPGSLRPPTSVAASGSPSEKPAERDAPSGGPGGVLDGVRIPVLVQDAREGRPLPAVRVSVHSLPGPVLLTEKQTDADGRTHFSATTGKYEVRAVWEADVENGNHDSDSDLVDAVRPGDYPVVLKLTPESDETVPMVRLRGTVKSEQGDRIPKARVNLYAELPENFRDRADEKKFARYKVARATTDARGEYTLRARLWPGRCSLVASHDDFNMLEGSIRREFPLTSAGHEGVYDFTLRRWEIKRITGIVVDAQGQPVAGAAVDFSDWSLDRSTRFFNTLETGADGRFEISCRLERCTIQASHPGHKSALKDCGVLSPAPAAEVRLVLEPSDAVLEGQVLTKTGVPVSGRKFKALEMNAASSRMQSMTPILPFTTDSNGRFRLSCTQGTRLSFAPLDGDLRILDNPQCEVQRSTQVILLRVDTP